MLRCADRGTLSVAWAALGLMLGSSLSAAQPSFETCDEQLAADPGRESAAECYQAVARDRVSRDRAARDRRAFDEAVQRLEVQIDRFPDSPWLHFYRGNLLMLVRPCQEDSESSYRRAIQLFRDGGDVDSEIRARTSLAWLLARCRVFDRAAQELDQTLELAPQGSDPLATLRLELLRARLPTDAGEDLDAIYRRLEGHWTTVGDGSFDDLPKILPLRMETLRALAQVSQDLGRNTEFRKWREEHRQRALNASDPRNVVAVDYGLLSNRMLQELLPSEGNRQRVVDDLWELLPEAQRVHADVATRIWWHLSKMLRGSEAEHCLERCQQEAKKLGVAHLQRKCALARAGQSLDQDPFEAARRLAEVYSLSFFDPDDALAIVDSWDDQFRVLWHTRPRAEALAGIERILRTIETLRSEQTGMARVEILDVWSDAYYWLAGRLLMDAADDDALRRSFTAMERLRSQELREILFMGRGEGGQLLPPPPPDLWDLVVAALEPNEAMLSFQLSLWKDFYGRFAGGAWVTVMTRERSWARRLSVDGEPVDRVAIESLVERLLGDSQGLDSPNGSQIPVELHKALLGPILEELPTGIDRLTVIPDGILHLLPFAALRSALDGLPISASYELTIEPSAALWLSWKQAQTTAQGSSSALVFADPDLSSVEGWEQPLREGDRAGGLKPLPHARREGKKVVRHLHGTSRLLQGTEASEARLKQTDLTPYGLLHFATHAQANSAEPWSSCVYLAGNATEDGCLRPDEIAELPLEGKAIILSACESAAGRWHRGEGVMSLARAFFKAGAPVVVGTLKPLPDDQGARFFDDFYRHLSRGQSLREALARTQRQWAERGAPVSAWANVVVLGNGDLVPAPGGIEPPPLRWGWVLVGFVVLATFTVGLAQALRRAKRRREPAVEPLPFR